MPIHFDAVKRCFSLDTDHSSYQFLADSHGFLLHLYYGPRAAGCADYLLTYADRGFSGSPYDCGLDRTYSLDTLPQEFPFQGSGDFRSAECIELLRQADIVCTNPPFSLFREFVAQLIKYDKKFLIIGNKNMLTAKDIFPLIMSNLLWVGYRSFSGGMWFEIQGDMCKTIKEVDGKILGNVPSCWFTNLDHKKRHDDIILYAHYTPEVYPHYVNYDGIEVGKTSEIPCDWDGAMGVPITFLDKYNPDQFEILGTGLELADMDVIKKRLGKLNGGPRLYIERNGQLVRLYERILIRRKQ